jgi:type III secretion protein W
MSRIDLPLSNTPTASSFDTGMRQAGPGAGDAALTGRLGGQQVAVDDGPDMLADAAEEISLHHSEKAESKHTAERKKELYQAMPLMAPEAIEAYMDAAEPGDEAEKLQSLAKRMLAGSGDPAALARQAFGQPTQQYLGLQYALQQGEREGAPGETLDAIREALADLEMDHGPGIRADLNTIGTAAEGAHTAADVAGFQATYRDVVLGDATLSGTLKLALERFGEGDFAAGLDRLTRALGQDLAAARPSTDPNRLQGLVRDLYHLGVAATVLDGCGELLATLAERHGTQVPASATAKPAAIALMQDLVGTSAEKWVSASRFTAMAEKHGATAPNVAIGFLTGVKLLLRDMPVQVFADGEQRQGVFQAAQEALDAAIDREEY